MNFLQSMFKSRYGVGHSVQYLRKIWNNGLIASLKKYRDIQEFKFGTLVGVDKFGNKYYEDKEESYLRDRWVEYADKKNYEASHVPPEWHAWIHRISDAPGSSPEVISLTPKYSRNHRFNPSGTSNAYTPPMYVLNPEYGAKEDPNVFRPKPEDLVSFKRD
eukprot:TRINITY_DN740_c0_g1_i1.p1 TRINITY_DN740_c0_g1~~TRINITY_DN740_c0_g1_i1.p1  ORF type:complete len:181 (+),score=43.70 TRINITY_DN740_c0_g1_i1:62-544(+)